jgi:pimeloyl-ACP methyl ester carboxylesterase
MHRLFIVSLLIATLISCSDTQSTCEAFISSSNEYIFDTARNRQIPTQSYFLSDSAQWNGELVILNAGYGSSNTEYGYISRNLAQKGYYVIAIQHEIQTDEMLPSGHNIIELRTPNWNEGVKSVKEVIEHVKASIPAISTSKIHLIGHSNGGDISVLYATKYPKNIHSLITLDHRRMPIPLSKEYKTLSFRADQFKADAGVIPSSDNQSKYSVEIIYLKNVDHNYLRDIGTKSTKEHVNSTISRFLEIKKK